MTLDFNSVNCSSLPNDSQQQTHLLVAERKILNGTDGCDQAEVLKKKSPKNTHPFYDSQEYDENGQLKIEGWPASAITPEQYEIFLENFRGFCRKFPSDYVDEILSCQSINIPHDKFKIEDSEGREQYIPSQALVDIRRRDLFTINHDTIYKRPKEKEDEDNPEEISIKGLSDLEKAKFTIDKCVEALRKDTSLAWNILKLITQGTLAHMTSMILPRFQNLELFTAVRCEEQWVDLYLDSRGVTTVEYHLIWGIYSLEKPSDPARHFAKASVEMMIPTEDLIIGDSANSIAIERCSPFYDNIDKAQLHRKWPAQESTLEKYNERITQFNGSDEELSILELGCLMKGVYHEYLAIQDKPEKYPHYLPILDKLVKMQIGEQSTFGQMDIDDLRSWEVKNIELYHRCREALQGKETFLGNLFLLINRCVCHLASIAEMKFSNKHINRGLECLCYEIQLTEETSSKREMHLVTFWGIKDITDLKANPVKCFKITASLQMELVNEPSPPINVVNMDYTVSKFYDSESEARNDGTASHSHTMIKV